MRTVTFLRGTAAVLGAFVMAGCYSYIPVERPEPRTVVRIQVPVTSAAANRNRAPETLSFEGTVVSFGDSLIMETKSRREIGAFREIIELDTLRLDPAVLAGLDERILSKPKTYGLTALVSAAAVGLVFAALEAGGGSAGGDDGGGNGVGAAIKVNPIVSGLLKILGR